MVLNILISKCLPQCYTHLIMAHSFKYKTHIVSKTRIMKIYITHFIPTSSIFAMLHFDSHQFKRNINYNVAAIRLASLFLFSRQGILPIPG